MSNNGIVSAQPPQLLDVSNVMSNNGIVSAWPPSDKDDQACGSSTVVVHSTVNKPLQKSMPTMMLSGCNFTNCTIAFSGNVVGESENKSDFNFTELLEGISVDQVLNDSM